MKVLLTSPDSSQGIGGIKTYQDNLVKVLDKLDISYDLFIWKGKNSFQDLSLSKNAYDCALHLHYMGGVYLNNFSIPNYNIIHGAEIAFSSPNIAKKLFKKLFRKKLISYISKGSKNIFVSSYSRQRLASNGMDLDYARDIVFHNCIDLESSSLFSLSLGQEWRFCAIARDVEHKNLKGCVSLCEYIQKTFNKEVILYVTSKRLKSPSIQIVDVSGSSSENLDKIYKNCHFNLLLSKDIKNRGFFEGFGLTVLEAARFGTPSIVTSTGGQKEAVHHGQTGFVVDHKEIAADLIGENIENYELLREKTYSHCQSSHGLERMEEFFSWALK